MNITQSLYEEAKKIIPGGTQLFSKRPDLYHPLRWPAYFSRAKGCRVWDLDNRSYLDMSSMGIGSCLLGYADPDVNNAVKRVINKGTMSTLNAPEDVSLAKLLVALHPWGEQVRFARTGGEAMSMAVRLARAKTGRDKVLFCGYHGWHDWYLSANVSNQKLLDGHLLPGLNPLGVPRVLRGTSFPFRYNDPEGFLKLISKYGTKIGAVVLESIRGEMPTPAFLEVVQKKTRSLGAILIVDEITAGFRLTVGGAHLLFGMRPDIAVFAKGMSNGYPMAALVGTKKVMSVVQDSFVSSTYWTERIGPTAALATIDKLKRLNIPQHLSEIGRSIKEGWLKVSQKYGIGLHLSGMDPLCHFQFNHSNPLILKTLFTQLMLKQGILASNAFYASHAHTPLAQNAYQRALEYAFSKLAKAVREGTEYRLLEGPVCISGFKRLT